MGNSSPFWYLAIGLGVAWIITSGRGQAILDVFTSPVAKTSPVLPGQPQSQPQGSIPPVNGVCTTPGYVFNPTTGMCDPVSVQ